MIDNFSPANLTAYVAIVNPALTSHVLNNIKIYFLSSTSSGCRFTRLCRRCVGGFLYDYTLSLQKSNALPSKLRKIDRFILFPIEPEHEINLRGVPPELVPGYFVNSLLVLTTYVIREGSGEHVRLRNLARVSLLTIRKFEVDEDSDKIKF